VYIFIVSNGFRQITFNYGLPKFFGTHTKRRRKSEEKKRKVERKERKREREREVKKKEREKERKGESGRRKRKDIHTYHRWQVYIARAGQ